MITNDAVSQPRIRGRSRPFRWLFGAVAGALILTGFIVPRANATLIVYFNFEDTPGTLGRDTRFDNYADAIAVGLDQGNTGGGTQFSILTATGGAITTDTGLVLNRSLGD